MTSLILAQTHLISRRKRSFTSTTRRHGDAVRVNIEAGEAAALFGGQFVRIGLGDAKFLEAAKHGGGELADALFYRAGRAR